MTISNTRSSSILFIPKTTDGNTYTLRRHMAACVSYKHDQPSFSATAIKALYVWLNCPRNGHITVATNFTQNSRYVCSPPAFRTLNATEGETSGLIKKSEIWVALISAMILSQREPVFNREQIISLLDARYIDRHERVINYRCAESRFLLKRLKFMSQMKIRNPKNIIL